MNAGMLMQKLLIGISAVGTLLVTTDVGLAQCCRMSTMRSPQARFSSVIPGMPYFPMMTPNLMTPFRPMMPAYPLMYPLTGTPSYTPMNPLAGSPSLPTGIPQKSRSTSLRTPTAIASEPQLLTRSPIELERKGQEIFEKGIKAERDGNMALAGTCFYNAFAFYPDTSIAPRARNAYDRLQAAIDRRGKSN